MPNIKKTLRLISALSLTNDKNPAVIPYKPQKTAVSGSETRYFHREKPEKHGVSSIRLYRMLSELEAEPRANIHNIMVVKDGAVISECHAPGYDINISHLSHSMSKTVVGMAIGFLADEGKLDINARLVDFFPEYTPRDKSFKKITLHHLLTMQSGVKLNEVAAVTEYAWTSAFFASKLAFEPGSSFKYNSMNSYMLAKVVEKISGANLTEFLRPRLFEPLGIENFFWELGPEGVEKGGWGLYLSLESWAKLGEMMLSGGVFEGKRLLSEEWVKRATSTHAKTSELLGDFNYGYQLWTARTGDDYLFNGMLGQNVWICPKNNLLVAINSGNNELFQQSPALTIIRKHLGGDKLPFPYEKSAGSLLSEKEKRFFESRRAVHPLAKRHGLRYLLGLGNAKPYDTHFDEFIGDYGFVMNNHSILPTFIRVMQSNYMGGIDSFSIERCENNIKFTSREGGKNYSFMSGIYDYLTTIVDFCGEKYIISSCCEITHNLEESNEAILKISIIFPELPNSVLITMTPIARGKMSVRISETPNQKLTFPFIEAEVADNKLFAFITTMIEKRFGTHFLEKRLTNTFEPKFVAINKAHKYYREQMDAMNQEEAERIASMRMLAVLINKFTREDDEDSSAQESERDALPSPAKDGKS